MAKRKRLTPANPAAFGAEGLETKSAVLARAPIADVASDAAATAALGEVTQELSQARAQGRMVLALPLDQIVLDHLVRDRLVADEEEMAVLIASIAARGQQTPIEVVELAPGRYGLISGWRRCQAIATLAQEGRHEGTVLALLRRPAEASEAYLSMVEENEIRVGLSYFERARIAHKAVAQGVFESEKAALLTLFAAASRPKRSKIRAFLPLVKAFDGVLRFPQAIGERLGLKLSAALEQDPGLAARLRQQITSEGPETAEAEQALLQRALAAPAKSPRPTGISEGAPNQITDEIPGQISGQILGQTPESRADTSGQVQIGADLEARWDAAGAWLRLSGPGLTPALRAQILELVRRLPR